MSRPPYVDEWDALAVVAERLRDDRVESDPRHVEAGRLTPRQAADRARLSEALVQQWQAIVARRPIPWLEASYAEIRTDLDAAAQAAAARAVARPDATIELSFGRVRYSDFAAAIAALAWQQQPYRDGTDTPRIVFVHSINQQARAERAARAAG